MFSSRSLIILSLLAACGSKPPAAAPAPSPSPSPLTAKLDAVVEQNLEGRPVPGISVAVVQRGETVLARGYRDAKPETVFRIGSITKSFTAAALVKLAAAGKLSIDDPITRFLPDYDTKGKTITVRQLLTHTSGIPGYTGLAEFNRRSAESFPRSELVAMFEKEPLEFDPGTSWSYSNSGYYLLGLIIEKVTGQTYAEALRALVLEPAGLTATSYCPSEMTEPTQARGFKLEDGKPAPADPLDMAHPFAAGSLCSTAPDLARWMGWLAADAALWKAMTTPGKLADGKEVAYGFGLGIGELEGHRMISHGGGINGFVSHMSYLPDDQVIIVVLSNIEGPAAPALGEKLGYAALGITERVVADLPLSAEAAAPFAGDYEIAEMKVKIGIRYQDGKLQVTNYDATGAAGPWLPAAFQGGVAFEIPQVKAKLAFVVTGGKATAIEIEQGGGKFTAVRVAR